MAPNQQNLNARWVQPVHYPSIFHGNQVPPEKITQWDIIVTHYKLSPHTSTEPSKLHNKCTQFSETSTISMTFLNCSSSPDSTQSLLTQQIMCLIYHTRNLETFCCQRPTCICTTHSLLTPLYDTQFSFLLSKVNHSARGKGRVGWTRLGLFATPQTIHKQSMEFSRPESWSG